MRLQRGALWNKWDLHVHTPVSLVQNYGGDKDEVWEEFFKDIESLPPEFKVLGINDYLFVDGYDRVLLAKRQGRLGNVDLILPVVELRIDKFGGTQGALSRVNLHVLFSDSISPDLIRAQFLNGLAAHYQLDPEFESLKGVWQALPTRESLIDLGNKIRDSVPADKKQNYTSPLRDGFNALNFQFDKVLDVLRKHYFENNFLTAVGKTEWASIKWNEGSVADKKTIINRVDFVFVSAPTVADCIASKTALASSGVNSRLLDCSDAHNFSKAPDKDSIGKCFTWICADTEFEGLRQARKEAGDRIYLGIEPETRKRLRDSTTKFLRRLTIKKNNAALDEPWFDGTDIELNPGFVAVIGNKGSGKSALADIIGLLGNSTRMQYASFLTRDRFRRPPENKAKYFDANLRWEDDQSASKRLSDDTLGTDVERVTYVPQSVFEEICNELQGSQRGKFDLELKSVIFSHVAPGSRAGWKTLDEMLEHRTSEIRAAADQRRALLSEVNRSIISLEQENTAEHREVLGKLLSQRKSELTAHEASEPAKVSTPSDTPSPAEMELIQRLEALEADLHNVDSMISQKVSEETRLNKEIVSIDRVSQRLSTLRDGFREFSRITEMDLRDLDIKVDQIVRLDVSDDVLPPERFDRANRIAALQHELSPALPDSLTSRRKQIAQQIAQTKASLKEPQAKYREYLSTRAEWEQRRAEIIGTTEGVGSVAFLEHTIAQLRELPTRLDGLYRRRQTLAKEIHEHLRKIAGLYEEVYDPVQKFIAKHPAARETFQLRFAVSIVDAGFEDQFLDWINRTRTGSFQGTEQAGQRIKEVLANHNFNDTADSVQFAESILKQLRIDARPSQTATMQIADQLRTGKTIESLMDFLFGFRYLEPRYELRMGKRDLHQLSPGEKGALLLVFYLLVDMRDEPLVIDQPEENLDNQTIVKLLVPSLKQAKQRRQIFIVTHNPNLAVVCDAEQVICAVRDPHIETRIMYEAGAIENPTINQRIMDVLEGTRPAFDNRSGKYHK